MTIHNMTVKNCGETSDGFVWIDCGSEDGLGVTFTLNFPHDQVYGDLVGRKLVVKGDWGETCKIVKWEPFGS